MSGFSNHRKIKNYLKLNFPMFYKTIRKLLKCGIAFGSNDAIFTRIYKRNSWKDPESISGSGSNLGRTKVIREQIPILIKDLKIKSLLDVPCGDLNWMKKINLDIVEEYVGIDIVEQIIEQNQKEYSNANKKFMVMDITDNKILLPRVDLILCRDCLVHFSSKDIYIAIGNFKRSNSTYLLTTTFTDRDENYNINTGEWRSLNLQLPPFNFPQPLKLINENCDENNGAYADKSLGLWQLSDINICE